MFTPEAMAGYVSTAILTIVNLLITYFILKRFLFKPILNVLRKRRIEVETELNDTAEKLKLAESKLADATERLNNSNHEAAAIVTTSRSQAEIQRESIMSDAKHEIAGMYTRADAEINRMRITMLNDVRDEVADLSVAIASKVIGQAMDDQRQRELIESFMDDQMRAKRGEA